jgi:nucleoid-associated protein YgaU
MAATIYSRYYGLDTVTVGDTPSLALRPNPPIQAYPDGLLHVVVGGETLDLLAFKYYGREDLWWRIADANPGRFPMDWLPGDKLMIPPLRVATRTAGR